MVKIEHVRKVRANRWGLEEQEDLVILRMSPEEAMEMIASMAKVVTPSNYATWQPRVEGTAHDGTRIDGHLVVSAARDLRCESCGEDVKLGSGAEALRSLVCNPCDEEIAMAIDAGKKARTKRDRERAKKSGDDHA